MIVQIGGVVPRGSDQRWWTGTGPHFAMTCNPLPQSATTECYHRVLQLMASWGVCLGNLERPCVCLHEYLFSQLYIVHARVGWYVGAVFLDEWVTPVQVVSASLHCRELYCIMLKGEPELTTNKVLICNFWSRLCCQHNSHPKIPSETRQHLW